MGCTTVKGEICGEGYKRAKKLKTFSKNTNNSKILESSCEKYIETNTLNKKNRNPTAKYEKKLSTKIEWTFNTSTNEVTFQSNIEDNILFPPGEHYYQLIKDSNKTKLIEKVNNLSERVELFFSLNNVYYPNNKYSFGISIINNKKIGNTNFLGYLKDGTGETIEFGDSFELDFFLKENKL